MQDLRDKGDLQATLLLLLAMFLLENEGVEMWLFPPAAVLRCPFFCSWVEKQQRWTQQLKITLQLITSIEDGSRQVGMGTQLRGWLPESGSLDPALRLWPLNSTVTNSGGLWGQLC